MTRDPSAIAILEVRMILTLFGAFGLIVCGAIAFGLVLLLEGGSIKGRDDRE
jgi:hypothetical protein